MLLVPPVLSSRCCRCFLLAVSTHEHAHGHARPCVPCPPLLQLLAGFGPVVFASAVSAVFRSSGGSGQQSLVNTLVQQVVGNVFCSVPIALACYLALQPATAVVG